MQKLYFSTTWFKRNIFEGRLVVIEKYYDEEKAQNIAQIGIFSILNGIYEKKLIFPLHGSLYFLMSVSKLVLHPPSSFFIYCWIHRMLRISIHFCIWKKKCKNERRKNVLKMLKGNFCFALLVSGGTAEKKGKFSLMLPSLLNNVRKEQVARRIYISPSTFLSCLNINSNKI